MHVFDNVYFSLYIHVALENFFAALCISLLYVWCLNCCFMCNVNNAANVITSLVTVDSALPSSHCI